MNVEMLSRVYSILRRLQCIGMWWFELNTVTPRGCQSVYNLLCILLMRAWRRMGGVGCPVWWFIQFSEQNCYFAYAEVASIYILCPPTVYMASRHYRKRGNREIQLRCELVISVNISQQGSSGTSFCFQQRTVIFVLETSSAFLARRSIMLVLIAGGSCEVALSVALPVNCGWLTPYFLWGGSNSSNTAEYLYQRISNIKYQILYQHWHQK